MATQGKCPKCNIRVAWHEYGDFPMASCHCPKCGEPLQRTTYLAKCPLVRELPRLRPPSSDASA